MEIIVKHIQLNTIEEALSVKELFDAGESFEDLAKKYSICSTANMGGIEHVLKIGNYDKIYEDTALALPEDGVSDPVETSYGIMIIKRCIDPRVWFRIKHIVSKTEETSNLILEKLKNGEDFDTLANNYSTCSSGKKANGDFGDIHTGMLAPEFEEAVLNIPVGETVGPVETRYGFHIIKRLK